MIPVNGALETFSWLYLVIVYSIVNLMKGHSLMSLVWLDSETISTRGVNVFVFDVSEVILRVCWSFLEPSATFLMRMLMRQS